MLHDRLWEEFSPESERVAAHRSEKSPYFRVYTPCHALWCVDPAFAMDGVHDADDVALFCRFCLENVAVSKKCDCVFVNLDDSMDQVVAIYVADKGYSADAEVFLFPRAEGQLVTKVNHERVHAVSFHCDGYCLAF